MSASSPRSLRPLVAALLAALAAPAWSIDLLESYRAAYEADATVRAARAAVSSARERVAQARAQLLPQASLSASRFTNDLNSTQPNILGQESSRNEKYFSYNQTLSVRQALYRRPLTLAFDQSQYYVADAQGGLDSEVENLAVRVTGAYLDALLALDQLRLVEAQQRSAAMQLELARKALAAGSGTVTDIDDAQAQVDLAAAQRVQALQNLDYTRRQLQSITQQPVQALAPLDAAALALAVPEPNDLVAWQTRARDGSPQIASLRARLEAARLEVAKAQATHQPTLDLAAQWTRSASENVTSPKSAYLNRSLGLQLTVPIYSGGYISSTVRQALAEQQRAEELLEAALRDLDLRVHREFRGVVEGIARVRALEQAVRSAARAMDSTRKSYQAGSRTLLDVSKSEQQWQSAQRDLSQARAEFVAAWVRLHALCGENPEQTVQAVNGWLARAEPETLAAQ